jgi:microcystin-dependent protein
MFAGNFAPAGWMTCDGQILAIADNDTLFSLIGTTYGGDGQSTFALPNLNGRVPVHMGTARSGTNYVIGAPGGAATVTIGQPQLPSHTHPIVADNNPATTSDPTNAYYANAAPKDTFTVPNSPTNPHAPSLRTFNAAVLPAQGGNLPHDNMQPYLPVTYIISLFGVFPSQ